MVGGGSETVAGLVFDKHVVVFAAGHDGACET